MTLGRLLQQGKEVLRAAGLPEADLDAWYLLEHVTGYTRNDYFLSPEREVETGRQKQYEEMLRKRSAHIPLQHLTGSQEFMGFSFYVNEQVLIPRQDTEILVEEAEKSLKQGMRILDLCTGSGCILFSILKRNPGLYGTGADVSPLALAVAEKNRAALRVEAELVESDLFERLEGSFDRILSNPPYIPSRTVDTLMEEVRDHEPRLALDGREDGLYFYRKIVKQSPGYLNPGGMLFLEIGYDQAEAVSILMEDSFAGIHVVKDLAGLPRVVYGTLRS